MNFKKKGSRRKFNTLSSNHQTIAIKQAKMVLDFQKKEKFQSVLRDLIVQACIENFDCKCTLDGIICITLSLPGGVTDEVIAKIHEELNESPSYEAPYAATPAGNKNKVIVLSREHNSRLKSYLTAPQRYGQKGGQNSRSYPGKQSLREASRQPARDGTSSPPLVANNVVKERNAEIQFSCSMCFAKFPTYQELERHFQETHSSTITHFCDICSIGFESEADCATHRQNFHNLKSNSGETTLDTSGSKITPGNRRKQVKPRKGLVDENNMEAAPGTVTAWNDQEAAAEDSPSRADDCQEEVYKGDLVINESNNNDLNQRNHNDFAGEDSSSPEDYGQPALVPCHICGDGFETFGLLEEHCHAVHRQYACNFCYTTFPQRANRDKHVYQKHSGTKPFPCSLCDASFTRKDALKKHRPKCKGILQATSFSPSSSARNSPLSGRCSILEAALQSKNENISLDGSIKMEIDDVDCGLDLSHGSRMKANSTDGNRSSFYWQDREFATNDNKTTPGGRSDQNSEEEEDNGPYPRSGEEGNSNSPSRLSSRSRAYKCDRCEAHVVGGTAFEDHCKVVHRRTPCLHCGKTFSQKGNMERHKRQHTGERPFSCTHCCCSYTRRETLKSHMSQSHGLPLPQTQQQLRQQRASSQVSPMILSNPLLMQTLSEAGARDRSPKEEAADNASSE